MQKYMFVIACLARADSTPPSAAIRRSCDATAYDYNDYDDLYDWRIR
jgi:hypothetical protein